MIKTFRKKSIIIFVIFIVAAILLTSLLGVVLTRINFTDLLGIGKADYSEQIEFYNTDVTDYTGQIKVLWEEAGEYTTDIDNLVRSRAASKAYIDYFKLMNNDPECKDGNFLGSAADDYRSAMSEYYYYNDQKEFTELQPYDEEALDYYRTKSSDLLKIIESRDYDKFISYLADDINNSPLLGDDEKAMQLKLLDLRKKLDPTGGLGKDAEGLTSIVQETLMTYQNAVETVNNRSDSVGYFSSDVTVTPQHIKECQEDIALIEYCAEHGYAIPGTMQNEGEVYVAIGRSFATTIIVIAVLTLAGAAIAGEITSGSIKSLIIAPVKRWKIYTAKLLMLVTVTIALALVKFLSVSAVELIFWNNQITPYIFVINGAAGSMNHFVYNLLYCLVEALPVFMFAMFAFMLSSVSRSTALSVGVSLGVYFGNGIVTTLVTAFAPHIWAKLLPFVHLTLADSVFNSVGLHTSGGINFMSLISGTGNFAVEPLFSVIYIVVLTALFIYTGFDSFTRKDI